ncbi:hypothetical protein HETIRDRAFT_104134 [Heterobasidion irregulare TC 32-1]|uniref:Uncharacterized protein n=1 Tax=Heterobasidion irregulare (strain TC 32-1) TaxID=747525 RepID=W4JYZ7_HETIT|nr:uncharacterized protein HETIRDRAFT_104134 [Heterobasidion irregulare TC 32-1]ETW78778.1 hypothetical protein HETIRDRAFT_104134 [Heterobasidion irregulare TC 32-1]
MSLALTPQHNSIVNLFLDDPIPKLARPAVVHNTNCGPAETDTTRLLSSRELIPGHARAKLLASSDHWRPIPNGGARSSTLQAPAESYRPRPVSAPTHINGFLITTTPREVASDTSRAR